MFKKRRGIKLTYNEQGLIHFICVNYDRMDNSTQSKIKNLCGEVAGEHKEALFAMLTDDSINVHGLARKNYISESQLYEYRRRFYESWDNKKATP